MRRARPQGGYIFDSYQAGLFGPAGSVDKELYWVRSGLPDHDKNNFFLATRFYGTLRKKRKGTLEYRVPWFSDHQHSLVY